MDGTLTEVAILVNMGMNTGRCGIFRNSQGTSRMLYFPGFTVILNPRSQVHYEVPGLQQTKMTPRRNPQ